MVALFPDCERPFLPALDAVSAQLPFAEASSWLAYDRPSPRSRCWIDVAEKVELYPDAIDLHLVASGEFVSPVAREAKDEGPH